MRKREKSAILTTIANSYYTVIACLMPFVIRSLLIKYIGIEYLGIKGLFESVLQVLNLVNLGADRCFFSYFLFKPCEDKDYETINAVMGLIKRIYFVLIGITSILGLILLPFLPYLVNSKSYPEDVNIYFIFIIYIIQNLSGYIIGYLSMIYVPFLLSHIMSLVWGTAFLIMYLFQAIIIIHVRSFSLFSLGLLLSNLLIVLFFHFYNKTKFPWLTYKGNLSKEHLLEFKKRIFPMFISKLRNVSRNSFDCIVISHFLGLSILAQYQNYYQIIIVPLMLIGILKTSIQPSLGNGISAETTISNYGILKQFTFVQNLAVTICTTCLITLIQPFMKIWLGKQYLLGMNIVICIVIYFYVLSIAEICVMLRDTTGTWRKGWWVAVIETMFNLIFNLLFVKLFGLWGIIFASIVTVSFINIPFELGYVFKYYFRQNYKKYLLIITKNTVITLIITIISYFICSKIKITNYFFAGIRCVSAVIISSILFLLLHQRDEEFHNLMEFSLRTIKEFKTKTINK